MLKFLMAEKRFNKLRFASVIVIFSVVAISLYTILDVIIFLKTGSELEYITPYVFSFFGGELVLLAAKRIFTKTTNVNTNTKGNG